MTSQEPVPEPPVVVDEGVFEVSQVIEGVRLDMQGQGVPGLPVQESPQASSLSHVPPRVLRQDRIHVL